MALIRLTVGLRRSLQRLFQRTRDAKVLRRAQALLELAQGKPVAVVARQRHVPRRTLYAWAQGFRQRDREPVASRLVDRPHLGRPPHKIQAVKALVEQVIDTDPRLLGYRSPVWTVPLLARHLKREQGESVSQRTVRRGLRQLRFRYKRPRYVLRRRSPTWRQAKGGSNVP